MDLKLLLRSKPVTDVDTSVGHIYLYPLREQDLTNFEKLEPTDAINQLRNFLTNIASLTVESDEAPERIPLDSEIAKKLSNDEVEQLAEAYVRSSKWQAFREYLAERKPIVQEEGETTSIYLIRLLKDEVEKQHEATRQLHEKIKGLSNHGLFDQVRKSTSALGSTLGEFEKFTKTSAETRPLQNDHFIKLNNLMEQERRERAKERAEEMKLTRLTGQMTAESARALNDLVVAAATMMVQMEARDISNDAFARKQINIAKWSFIASAFLAFLSLLLAGLTYFQDRDNNTAGEKWQKNVIEAIKQGNEQHSTIERENNALLDHVKSQGSRIAALEAAQRVPKK